MANFKKNEEGVSAVIGVILMVAITVILAAVIAAFVFQLGNQLPQSSHSVGATVLRTITDFDGAGPLTYGVVQIKTMSGDVSMLKSDDSITEPTYKVVITATGLEATACDAAGATVAPAVVSYDASKIGTAMYFQIDPNSDVTVLAQYTDGTTSNVFSGKI